jgi:hypothetical protein
MYKDRRLNEGSICSDVERKLGRILLSQNPNLRVDLNNPEEEVLVFLSDMVVVGKSLKKVDRSLLKIREVLLDPLSTHHQWVQFSQERW